MTDQNTSKPSLSYKDAGVDIDAGNALIERIKHVAKRTRRPEVMAGLGGFGALCEIPTGYKEPVLVSGTDGVVAMCVNDLIVAGAEPLFFLDYYATGKLNIDTAAAVVEGIGKGCELSGCSLVGGETAEMPGMYEGEDYDLAGFCVGVAEKSKLIDGSAVKSGDTLIGLASSGAHSNGYSLIRKIIEVSNADLSMPLGDQSLGMALMAPTRIYVKSILALMKKCPVHALSHITGGGLLENIPRVLPANCKAVIDTQSWQQPEVFAWLQSNGNVDSVEMYRTFNCGVGMVISVDNADAQLALEFLSEQGEEAWIIGHVAEANDGEEQVELQGL